MIKPSEKVLRAMVALQHDDNFVIVREWLAEQGVKVALDCVLQKDEVMVRWMQGEAQALTAIHKIIKECRDMLIVIDGKNNR